MQTNTNTKTKNKFQGTVPTVNVSVPTITGPVSTSKISIEVFMSMRKHNPYKINPFIIEKCKLKDIMNIEIISNKKNPVLELKENSWYNNLKDSNQEDTKIISILNKINDANYTKLLNEIRNEN